MNHRFSQMSTPPGGPSPGYGGPPPGYEAPPKKNSTAKIVLIVLAVVFGGGIVLASQKVRSNARLALCEAGVRQISLCLLQYTQDHNEKLPPKAAAYKDAVFPYIQSESVFHCPADQGGPVDYPMNANLQGVSLDKISHPAEVVAIYEGHNQTLDFRHEGKAVVGFADGHDQALTQVQAKNLKWKP